MATDVFFVVNGWQGRFPPISDNIQKCNRYHLVVCRIPGTQLINDRTDRVLNILYVIQAVLLTRLIPHLSRHNIALKADYYRLPLKATRTGNLESWVIFTQTFQLP